MRMHSALHLLCSLIPYDVTGGQISYEKSRLDFNADSKIENNNIILEETAFYAKSGGQPGDIGKILLNNKEINIIDTIYDQDKNIIHICEEVYDLKKRR